MGNDRRRSFRCASPNEREIAMLRFGDAEAVVKVVEESAEGIGILTPKSVMLTPGQEATLICSAGACTAEIVRIVEQGDEFRVGMRRLREIPLAQVPKKKRASSFNSTHMALAVAVVSLLAMAVVLSKNYFFVPAFESSHMVGHVSLASFPNSEQQVAVGFTHLDELAEGTITRQLKLTGQQQIQIESTVDDLTRKLALLLAKRDQEKPGFWAEQSLVLLHDSWRQIDAALTPEQRMRWQELAGHNQE